MQTPSLEVQETSKESLSDELKWKTYANRKFNDRESAVNHLVILSGFKEIDRKKACKGVDPLEFLTLYAQDNLAYRPDNTFYEVNDREKYSALESRDKLNKFGQSYVDGTYIYCNEMLAKIMVDAAISFYNKHDMKIRVYDVLRTVDSAFLLYRNSSDEDRALLAKPCESAHNMGMAIDITVVDKNGADIERVDHPVLDVIHRNYNGNEINDRQKFLRLELEKEFQKAAYKNGVVVAPLPRENWDFRFLENLKSPMLHRAVESLARCTDQHDLYQEKWNGKKLSYNDFRNIWKELNKEGALDNVLGVKGAKPPKKEDMEAVCYSRYAPIFDKELEQRYGVKNFAVPDAELEAAKAGSVVK